MRMPIIASLTSLCLAASVMSCEKDKETVYKDKIVTVNDTLVVNIAGFSKISNTDLSSGAEISAFDPTTKKLFITGGNDQVGIVDLTDPTNPLVKTSLSFTNDVQSVAIHGNLLAIAEAGSTKQVNGKIHVYKVDTEEKVTSIDAGALPDNVSFSKDGKWILSANEGEPNDDYTNDPKGSVTIVDVANNYAATTADFSSFSASSFSDKSFRIYGPGASLAQDVEPEYIAISDDNSTAWVSLQENNAIAKIDIASKSISSIHPLGFKDYSKGENAIDVSDKDDEVNFKSRPNIVGIYQPDAISYVKINGTEYILTANEGDARDYDGYSEEERIDDATLNAAIFTDANIQDEDQLGRLKYSTVHTADNDNGAGLEEIVSYGARSFSIWNAATMAQVYDSGNELEAIVNSTTGLYPDGRSDDKGVEPEAITVGKIGDRYIAFVGLERANCVVSYDITDPNNPSFLQVLETGVGPEGIVFVSFEDSPNGRPLLIVSSEKSEDIQIFQL